MHTIPFDEAWRVYRAAAPYMPPVAPAVTPRRIAGVLDVAADFDVLVFDAYGVLNVGNRPLAPALTAMRALADMGKAVCILTRRWRWWWSWLIMAPTQARVLTWRSPSRQTLQRPQFGAHPGTRHRLGRQP